ncbi:MAG: sugar phosphate nucleotidyltransferase, partial [Chitinispirillia bacterium]|nr:sugar phosphate nucleotidyltransferase [Chitinispirillia bacterium]
EDTLLRLDSVCSDDTKPMIITGASIAEKVKSSLKNYDDVDAEIISEPIGKNTAPAIALGAAIIQKRYGDAVMIVVSADHAISPKEAFADAANAAVELAKTGGIVVFGIKPSRPETGYGYIETGASLSSSNNIPAFVVKRFVEKPDAANAKRFMEEGTFLWNSGMFVWKASTILNEFREHMPDLYRQAMTAAEKNFTDEAINEFYNVCEKESIDFGIMEKAKNVSVVAGNFSWDDLGAWESLSRIHGVDKNNNTVSGPLVFEQECNETLLINKSSLTLCAVGLDNVALIAVDDAVLAIDRSKLPDLKKYLTQIKESKQFPEKLF